MSLPECIHEARLVVLLDPPLADEHTGKVPDANARFGQLVPALEVMVQEGLGVFSLSPQDLDHLDQLREIFDERASFGAHDVADHDVMARVVQARVPFVLISSDDADLVRHGCDQGVPVLPAALTPNEVRRAAGLGAPGVQVMPADLFGSSYPEQLRQLVPGVEVLPRGGLGGWAMGRWFDAGVRACIADTNLLGDALSGGNLSHLRDRSRTFLDVVPNE